MRNSWTFRMLTVALIAGGGVSMLASASGTVSAGEPSGEVTVDLHNTTTDNVQSCLEVPGLVTPAWHFVAPGGSFVNINSLTVGGETLSDPSYLSYPTIQHAYVTVPAGKSIGDLQGGEFVVINADQVVLSHVCTGTVTTTTTTTTEPATTTTTTAATTTTEPATTTTTTEATTTTVPASLVTTTESASAGPTTTAPTTTVALATQLPATGNSSWTLFFVGLASALGGLGLIKISRRPA